MPANAKKKLLKTLKKKTTLELLSLYAALGDVPKTHNPYIPVKDGKPTTYNGTQCRPVKNPLSCLTPEQAADHISNDGKIAIYPCFWSLMGIDIDARFKKALARLRDVLEIKPIIVSVTKQKRKNSGHAYFRFFESHMLEADKDFALDGFEYEVKCRSQSLTLHDPRDHIIQFVLGREFGDMEDSLLAFAEYDGLFDVEQSQQQPAGKSWKDIALPEDMKRYKNSDKMTADGWADVFIKDYDRNKRDTWFYRAMKTLQHWENSQGLEAALKVKNFVLPKCDSSFTSKKAEDMFTDIIMKRSR